MKYYVIDAKGTGQPIIVEAASMHTAIARGITGLKARNSKEISLTAKVVTNKELEKMDMSCTDLGCKDYGNCEFTKIHKFKETKAHNCVRNDMNCSSCVIMN